MQYPRAASLEQRQVQNPEKVTEDPAFGKTEEEGRDAQE